ncbi:DUF551 domain-containing protein [Klebsiella pneumoniae]
MSEFSRETLLNIIETDHVQCGEASALARMALAAMDSEPVAWRVRFKLEGQPGSNFNKFFENRKSMDDVVSLHELDGFNIDVTPLYRHAQQPVVPDAYVRDEHGRMMLNGVYEPKIGFGTGWNACRAAMLQAGTLTNEGTKQAWAGIPDIDNAINMLDRIDTLESCDDDRIEAVKTVLRRLAGNSPVIPDGYVMVPKEMTDEIGEAIAMQANCCGGIALDIYDAMLAAAPHDTPALNSVQSVVTVPGKWIPVSERMPEIGDIVLTAMGVAVNVGEMECSAANYRFFTSVISGRELPATHWMPLPAGPQEVR